MQNKTKNSIIALLSVPRVLSLPFRAYAKANFKENIDVGKSNYYDYFRKEFCDLKNCKIVLESWR